MTHWPTLIHWCHPMWFYWFRFVGVTHSLAEKVSLCICWPQTTTLDNVCGHDIAVQEVPQVCGDHWHYVAVLVIYIGVYVRQYNTIQNAPQIIMLKQNMLCK